MPYRQGDVIGWNLLYNTLEKDIKCKQDVLISLIHLILVNRKYRLVDSSSVDQRSTEILPSTWNSNSSLFVLTYINTVDQKIYELQGLIPCEDVLVVNFLDKTKLDVKTVCFKLSEYVHSLYGSLDDVIPKHKDIVENIHSLLVSNTVANHSNTGCIWGYYQGPLRALDNRDQRMPSMADYTWVPLNDEWGFPPEISEFLKLMGCM